ncbi:MAG: hypothetical protein Pg6B_10850 [Candidatus Azobacteroides pseudotrichonymphae]|jgi:hypothetical protein|uniref:hypothetical protein n=1 Tax=Candidatus Azobacteroides pseudotrichonymphae TaxID=511435 RepID=UPI0003042923|nr:hypothetical protein [Candidatus Azobacteroides pseudotrichonymphae]GMO38524.1 MAG: hypothetical protein Pg6B_10850 [Candidatus Azobacteroides pseudotrichonymphae]
MTYRNIYKEQVDYVHSMGAMNKYGVKEFLDKIEYLDNRLQTEIDRLHSLIEKKDVENRSHSVFDINF